MSCHYKQRFIYMKGAPKKPFLLDILGFKTGRTCKWRLGAKRTPERPGWLLSWAGARKWKSENQSECDFGGSENKVAETQTEMVCVSGNTKRDFGNTKLRSAVWPPETCVFDPWRLRRPPIMYPRRYEPRYITKHWKFVFSEPSKSGLRKHKTLFRNHKLGRFSPLGFVIPEVLFQRLQYSSRLPGPNTSPGHTPAYRKRSQSIGNLRFDSERQTVVRKHKNPVGNTK